MSKKKLKKKNADTSTRWGERAGLEGQADGTRGHGRGQDRIKFVRPSVRLPPLPPLADKIRKKLSQKMKMNEKCTKRHQNRNTRDKKSMYKIHD